MEKEFAPSNVAKVLAVKWSLVCLSELHLLS